MINNLSKTEQSVLRRMYTGKKNRKTIVSFKPKSEKINEGLTSKIENIVFNKKMKASVKLEKINKLLNE